MPPRIEPIVSGTDIIHAFGVSGKDVGRLKAVAFQAQLDEAFADVDGGITWLRMKGF